MKPQLGKTPNTPNLEVSWQLEKLHSNCREERMKRLVTIYSSFFDNRLPNPSSCRPNSSRLFPWELDSCQVCLIEFFPFSSLIYWFFSIPESQSQIDSHITPSQMEHRYFEYLTLTSCACPSCAPFSSVSSIFECHLNYQSYLLVCICCSLCHSVYMKSKISVSE